MLKIDKSIIHSGLSSVLFIAICFLMPLILSQEAYAEMKKISGTSKRIKNLLRTSTSYGETKVRFINNLTMFNSTDPDWDKAKSFNASYIINPTGQGDDYTGCKAITHPGGDQTFILFRGSWKWVSPRDVYRFIFEAKGRFTGGTGKFKGIRGYWRIKGKGDGMLYVTGEWEVEYTVEDTKKK